MLNEMRKEIIATSEDYGIVTPWDENPSREEMPMIPLGDSGEFVTVQEIQTTKYILENLRNVNLRAYEQLISKCLDNYYTIDNTLLSSLRSFRLIDANGNINKTLKNIILFIVDTKEKNWPIKHVVLGGEKYVKDSAKDIVATFSVNK